jgi:hypothetical protein
MVADFVGRLAVMIGTALRTTHITERPAGDGNSRVHHREAVVTAAGC